MVWRWLLFTCHLANWPPATAADSAADADADALVAISAAAERLQCCGTLRLHPQFAVCSLPPEVAAVVIAARFVFHFNCCFCVVCLFRTQFCQAPHCLSAV